MVGHDVHEDAAAGRRRPLGEPGEGGGAAAGRVHRAVVDDVVAVI
jgi:hypothetical protein